jgi:hypothetical protein
MAGQQIEQLWYAFVVTLPDGQKVSVWYTRGKEEARAEKWAKQIAQMADKEANWKDVTKQAIEKMAGDGGETRAN